MCSVMHLSSSHFLNMSICLKNFLLDHKPSYHLSKNRGRLRYWICRDLDYFCLCITCRQPTKTLNHLSAFFNQSSWPQVICMKITTFFFFLTWGKSCSFYKNGSFFRDSILTTKRDRSSSTDTKRIITKQVQKKMLNPHAWGEILTL